MEPPIGGASAMAKKVEQPHQYPVQSGRRIASGNGSVRDRERVESKARGASGPTDAAVTCGVCGVVIPPRSIRPGAPRCAKHRTDAITASAVYHETAKRKAERAEREAKAAAMLPFPEKT